MPQVDLLYNLDHKASQMLFRQPVLNRRRLQVERFSINLSKCYFHGSVPLNKHLICKRNIQGNGCSMQAQNATNSHNISLLTKYMSLEWGPVRVGPTDS